MNMIKRRVYKENLENNDSKCDKKELDKLVKSFKDEITHIDDVYKYYFDSFERLQNLSPYDLIEAGDCLSSTKDRMNRKLNQILDFIY